MFDDEEDKPKHLTRPKLEVMSVEALHNYIAELEAEIGRAREMIDAKQSLRGDADALFKR